MRGFAPPRPQKFPYNAALNGPAIFPYRDNSQSEAHAEVFTDFCARQRLSEPRTNLCLFACVYRCKKRYPTRPVRPCEKPTNQFSHGQLALTQETTRHAELGRIRQRR